MEDTLRKFHDAKVVPVSRTPSQTAAMITACCARWAPVVQKSGYPP